MKIGYDDRTYSRAGRFYFKDVFILCMSFATYSVHVSLCTKLYFVYTYSFRCQWNIISQTVEAVTHERHPLSSVDREYRLTLDY